MKWTDQQIQDKLDFLTGTLIPDLHESSLLEQSPTGKDFEDCCSIIQQLREQIATQSATPRPGASDGPTELPETLQALQERLDEAVTNGGDYMEIADDFIQNVDGFEIPGGDEEWDFWFGGKNWVYYATAVIEEWHEPTHRYTGKTTMDGLARYTRVIIVGKQAGGKVVKRYDGKQFIVGAHQLEKLEKTP